MRAMDGRTVRRMNGDRPVTARRRVIFLESRVLAAMRSACVCAPMRALGGGKLGGANGRACRRRGKSCKKSREPMGSRLFGADDEARTRYLHLGKVALYQMSYVRIFGFVSERCLL